MSIEQRHDSRSAGHPAKPSTARRFIVLGRWALVAAGIVAIALGFAAASPVVRFAAFAGLSFLLANALWQHMPLSQACAAAAAIAIVFGAAVALYRLFAWGMGLESWLPDALGAVVGALVAYPALKRIDRISPDGL
ncbi:Tat pathway signal protein [Gordonibacter massiliensis (ex Traore et al. 2017)]|uniref:Tat pathway signal protein n=1 Tax=Gordonibacter massiliensis (ex Traore et al. 2017) TaxID=1841863 RepID=UPI001C8BE41C|nr:Tat pathway signal protein [Gordonibacter massiliensis (ex Traore et al. 2017)]MBX9034294.1 Tat pathway signal protein [Gordonibacter massiliensis (ex Traore et al. 2017)]